MMAMRIFPNAKDVSESMGALEACCRHGFADARLQMDHRSNERRGGVLMLAIGDGATPRTAGLAAFVTRWSVVSIDPELQPEWEGKVSACTI